MLGGLHPALTLLQFSKYGELMCRASGKVSSSSPHVLCVSPYPHHLKTRPTNPVLYWLGAFKDSTLDLPSADGKPLLCLALMPIGPACAVCVALPTPPDGAITQCCAVLAGRLQTLHPGPALCRW